MFNLTFNLHGPIQKKYVSEWNETICSNDHILGKSIILAWKRET